jgi:hypothetical protein
VIPRVDQLTGATVEDAPPPCRTCMWWQTRPGRPAGDRRRFIEQIEDEFGPWGKLYRDDGRVVGLIQCGPAGSFPRASVMPAGPPSREAVVVTCAYLIDAHTPWVLQSLMLAVIGECKDRGLPFLEAFAYRYPAEETFPGRFLRHRTIFPADFLRDFGFVPARAAGRIELARLDLRTIETVPEASRLERLRARLSVLSTAPAAPAAP